MTPARSALRLIADVALIVVAGAGVGLGVNAMSPRSAPLSTAVLPTSAQGACEYRHEAVPARISQPDALAACGACTAAFVDARSEEAFARGHIMGAVHRPEHGHPDEASLVDHLRGFSTVVVYDDDVGCRLAEGVARHLMAEGLTDVRVLEGSWTGWEASGGPAQSGACEVCAQPAARTADAGVR